jgi:hypothetical protein
MGSWRSIKSRLQIWRADVSRILKRECIHGRIMAACAVISMEDYVALPFHLLRVCNLRAKGPKSRING